MAVYGITIAMLIVKLMPTSYMCLLNVGRFGHGRFGLGRFGLGRFGHGRFGSAIFEGGRFGQIYFWIRFSMIKHANNTTVITTFIVQPFPHFITII